MTNKIIMVLIYSGIIMFFLRELILSFDVIIIRTLKKRYITKRDKRRLTVGMMIVCLYGIVIYIGVLDMIRIWNK